MDSQNTVYECSRKNAVHQVSNSEWINEWNEGIHLKKGDTVRLLGSFISEVGDGNDISISEDTKFTMDFEPYINAETVEFEGTTDEKIASSFQLRLGDIAQPAYATDNFGVEPPYATPKLAAQDISPGLDNNLLPVADRFQYNNDYGQHSRHPYAFKTNDDAQKIGAYFDTSSGLGDITADDVTNKKFVPRTLSEFNEKNMPQEFRIAHLCKLLKFPLFNSLKFRQNGTDPDILRTFLTDDILQVGDNISTYHIGNYPTLDPPTATQADYPIMFDDEYGEIKWKAGPQSVVGTVVATKIIYEKVYDPVNDVEAPMEFQLVYVQDWINPGQYKYENDLDGTAQAPRHGAPEKQNGYNTYRTNNLLNGFGNPRFFSNYLPNGGTGDDPIGTTTADIKDYYVNHINRNTLNGLIEFNPDANQVPTDNNPRPASTVTNQAWTRQGNSNAGLSFLWAGKGGWGKQNFSAGDQPDGGGFVTEFTGENFTSWIEYYAALTGSIDLLAGAANVAPITIGDTFFYLGVDQSFYQLRSNSLNVGSPMYIGPNPGDFFGDCENIEPVEKLPSFGLDYPYYFKITTSNPFTVNYTVGQINNFHYQRFLGGWRWTHTGTNMAIYAYPSVSPNIRPTIIHSSDLKDVGAIVKMNPNDDNTPYNVPANPAFSPRMYCPYRKQSVKSPYEVRNFGAGSYQAATTYPTWFPVNADGVSAGACPDDRRRHIFGTSPGYLGGGDTTDPNTNRTLPFPFGLTIDGSPIPTKLYTFSMYNEQCNSVYFQNEVGNTTYQKPADDNAISNDILWKQDLLYIKRYKTEFTIPAGFYSPTRMADLINDQLHYDSTEYQEKVGDDTTVGSREQALTSGNNVVRGNFIHTYIPELAYGFIPFTDEVQTNLNNSDFPIGITDNVNSLFLDYTTDALNGQLVTQNNNTNYYTVPYTHKTDGTQIENDGNLFLFRLIGGRLSQTTQSDDMKDIDPSRAYNNRFMDMIATDVGTTAAPLDPQTGGVFYQNRGYKNRLMYGGSAKIWVGAVNPTFSFDLETSLFNWSFLYTPYRPAADESGSLLTLTGGEAVPSAIINSNGTGGLTESLSGIYIFKLNAEQISNTNTRPQFDLFGNGASFPLAISDYVQKATDLWNTLGYSDTLLNSYNLNNTPQNPYVFIESDVVNGHALRNEAEVDISANGTNPLKSYCSLWAPPLQFAVIVESNRQYGDSKPRFGNTPFYLIGSSFPTKEYYGGKGTKLPIIGICSRQFSSFGFAFDLSESSVTLTIDHDTTITSIRTKIYNNDFTIPTNLDKDSSIIYVIERNNYYPSPLDNQLQAAEKEIEEQNPEPQYTPQMFEYLAPVEYEAPLYLIDSDDEDLE